MGQQTKHFSSAEGFKKNMAYIHMHGVAGNTPSKVVIAGKPHTVDHSKRQVAMKNRAEKSAKA